VEFFICRHASNLYRGIMKPERTVGSVNKSYSEMTMADMKQRIVRFHQYPNNELIILFSAC